MSTILESNSEVDIMSMLELLMHENLPCESEICENTAEWRGKFCRPCNVNPCLCAECKTRIEEVIRLAQTFEKSFGMDSPLVCSTCSAPIDLNKITWTKI